jgi:hypothetical protein
MTIQEIDAEIKNLNKSIWMLQETALSKGPRSQQYRPSSNAENAIKYYKEQINKLIKQKKEVLYAADCQG